MISEVLLYEPEFVDECKRFCKERDITFLPSVSNNFKCWKCANDHFFEFDIEESQIVNIIADMFDDISFEKFRKHNVLFVQDQNHLAGVVHFSDYNKEPVFVYLYTLLLNFESNLRVLLGYSGLNNKDMREFFESRKTNAVYAERLENYEKNKDKIEQSQLFQWFYLSDLIDLINSRSTINIDKKVCELRNPIMHVRKLVEHQDYAMADRIYDFNSFKVFFENVKLLRHEYKRIVNHVRYKKI